MFRYRKSKTLYNNFDQNGCPFCTPTEGAIVSELGAMRVIQNIFPYDLWEFRDVTEHLLVAPKRHIKSIGEFNEREQDEFSELIKKYEALDYNIYARSIDSVKKTVPAHQHTHLIKTNTKKPHFALFIARPYFLFKR